MGLPIPTMGPTWTLGMGVPTWSKTKSHTVHEQGKQLGPIGARVHTPLPRHRWPAGYGARSSHTRERRNFACK
ncbi:unnamed protein product [Spirodela intermedia]|uniref:Uncharacterized protein n=2 Tax=Spirodela intermedia TaxID=51605 RepID=A0A7I8KP57_SPIIN|nr:unnamed protein product [Spirodela intermedia]CAA6662456.1 unnamed protein product [Spirodela intermedia]CAA7398854.1 unnamed protein product [Spirodela intermedia]